MFNEFQPIKTLAEVLTFASVFLLVFGRVYSDNDFAEYVTQNGKPASILKLSHQDKM